jgi:small subunit ribosomal protein S21
MKRVYPDSGKNKTPLQGMVVEVRNNNIDKALRVLKKKLQDDGFFNELRKREYYMSKGEKRRLSKAAGKRRVEKENEKRLEELGF